MIRLSFLSKKNILTFLLVLWMIFSIGYIGWGIWTDIKTAIIKQSYQQGVSDTVNQLIQQAEDNNCQLIHIFNQEANKDIQLINTTCVNKSE